MFLYELNIPIKKVKGVGPKLAEKLEVLGIRTVLDLLVHFPRTYQDRSKRNSLKNFSSAPVNTVATISRLEYFPFKGKRALKLVIEEDSIEAGLLCFGRNFLADSFPVGSSVYVYGTFEMRFNELQTSAFELENPQKETPLGKVLPIYPLTEGITQKRIGVIMQQVLSDYAAHIEDPFSDNLRSLCNCRPLADCIMQLHNPASLSDALASRREYAFRELIELQLMIGQWVLARQGVKKVPGHADGVLQEKLISTLPFELTVDQKKVLNEIKGDFESDIPMHRLVQGDVGSGKTLVAVLSALLYVENGRQVAIMAPTELLAKQHADNIQNLVASLGIQVGFFTGKMKNRKPALEALKNGEIQIAVGTHALFSRDLVYKDLGLAIIDEQHRFGVKQREKLLEKGDQSGSASENQAPPDLLMMTATPIPQTLALTAFGDMEISTIKHMPGGRKKISSHTLMQKNAAKAYQFIRDEVARGHQAYIVYPLIEEGSKKLKNLEDMFEYLKTQVFPDIETAPLHSRMPEDYKEETMQRFADGEIKILVATSVIEVGVNVPRATCMMIEHPEVFGLAALHQLRGRVGRSDLQSYCFFVFGEDLTDIAKDRLRIIKEQDDGFVLAEEDLRIRGPGDILGTKQAGFLRLALADLSEHNELLIEARKIARDILFDDPALLSAENASLGRSIRYLEDKLL